jgi:hypothetical protein
VGCNAQPDFVVPIDDLIQVEVSFILNSYPRLVHTKRNRSQADPFVIALARLVNGTVVSGERRRSLINPKIPDVCDDIGNTHLELVEVFRRRLFGLGPRQLLGTSQETSRT